MFEIDKNKSPKPYVFRNNDTTKQATLLLKNVMEMMKFEANLKLWAIQAGSALLCFAMQIWLA